MVCISVIVPIYNVEKYLLRCLDSISNQTFRDFEVILINDGSSDRSGDIARNYSLQHDKFKYYEKENGGLGSARNWGIDLAEGEYLSFVDSDDWIEPDFLSKNYNACINNNADISMCGIDRVWDSGRRQTFNSGFTENAIFEDIDYVLINTSNVAWNKLYKKDLFNGIRYPDRMTYEDMACTPCVIAKAKRIVYIEEHLYNYYWRDDSITIAGWKKINHDILKAFSILEDSNINDRLNVLSAIFLKTVICSYLWSLYLNGNNKVNRVQLLSKLNGMYRCSYKVYDYSKMPLRLRFFIKLCKTNIDFFILVYVKIVCYISSLSNLRY